ncbi:PREDICTED: ATPase inhibitor, mitochondrial-like [Rhagoletis zephyria]|uniref:ATPase inhibitor, mitochondrial n=1 Tax=Rhagoletis zephyria TaxID=28612 RepID=UPI00081156CA|nr:PREDICTED: ATPase inhibitor, mitochondrial [Rhagoletis zephyria]XP_017494686.1 PREDICTED: ATPase inhibitor, mitochondrial-like [Rhagoletis zephyria]XP_036331688.1 ATPase inhibitor, mitochondrial-like [Rhagoletis pomonella]
MLTRRSIVGVQALKQHCRKMSQVGELGSGAGKGGGGGGSIREAGGSFGKMEAAREEEFFYKQQKEQLKNLKTKSGDATKNANLAAQPAKQ